MEDLNLFIFLKLQVSYQGTYPLTLLFLQFFPVTNAVLYNFSYSIFFFNLKYFKISNYNLLIDLFKLNIQYIIE